MRILHVLDHSLPLHSGYTFRTQSIVTQQRALGWEPVLMTGPRQGKTEALLEEIDDWSFFRTVPPRGIGARLPALRHAIDINATARRLKEVIRHVRPEVIHAHSPALNGAAALRAGRNAGLPVIYEVRAFWEDAAADHGTARAGSMRYRASQALETHVMRRADAVTTICDGLRQAIIGRGVAPEKVTVIPNAVNPERFRVGAVPDVALARELGLEGRTVLGFIGSFYAYEGLDLLVKALPGLLQRDPGVRVLLVGGGPQEAALKKLVVALGVQESVIFTGRVPHEQVQRYYDLVDLFVYPRRSIRLTELVTPLKPLEAMAQGRLVAASDVGGHRELIRAGETGALFPADDVPGLQSGILGLLQSRGDWPVMQKAARAFVENERSWSASVARYGRIYTALSGATAGEGEYA